MTAAVEELTCRRCGETKPLAEMKADKRNTIRGYSSFCRKCHQASTIAWQKANPERLKAWRNARYAMRRDEIAVQRRAKYDSEKARWGNIARLYGITREQYEAMLAAQGGQCALCDHAPADRPLAIDHDHSCCPCTPTCGKCSRGLLCAPCNLALNRLESKQHWAQVATAYLQKWNQS